MRIFFPVAFLIAALMPANATAEQPASKPSTRLASASSTFADPHKTFRFKYPRQWTKAEPAPKGVLLELTPDDEGIGKVAVFLVMVQHLEQTPDKPLDLKAVVAAYINGQKSSTPDVHLLRQEETTIAGTAAVLTDDTRTSSGIELRGRTCLIQHGDQVIVFQVVADRAKFPLISMAFDTILESLKWTAPTPQKTLSIPEHGIDFKHPSGWRDAGQLQQGVIANLRPDIEHAAGTQIPSVRLIARKRAANADKPDAAAYAQVMLDAYKAGINEFKLIENKETNVAGTKGRRVAFTGRAANGVALECGFINLIGDQENYTFIVYADPAVFDELMLEVEEIMDSIELMPQQ